jgi:hypothetical protein
MTSAQGVTGEFHDSLQAYAMVRVQVAESGTVRGVADVTVTVVDSTGVTAAAARSSQSGSAEIAGIPDGVYTVMAGKSGLSADTITPSSRLTVVGGRPDVTSFGVTMSAGTKIVTWVVRDGQDRPMPATIKIQSPLMASMSSSDTLKGAGAGAYSIIVDAPDPSVLDLVSYRLDVSGLESEKRVEVTLPVVHTTASDTLKFTNDSLTVTVRSSLILDSARIYYRMENEVVYTSQLIGDTARTCNFRFVPGGDGRDLVYYFVAYCGGGSLVYGYEKETFRRFVEASPLLSKLEIVPSSAGDTLLVPANYDMTLSFRGYYSSAFVLKENIDSSKVQWSVRNCRNCRLSTSRGLTVDFSTGDSASSPLEVTATVSRSEVRPTADTAVSVLMKVLGLAFDSIGIRRVDAGDPEPVTAGGSRAVFSASGFSRKAAGGPAMAITPQWRVAPPGAGTIAAGVFTPSRVFAGHARIFASAANVSQEYSYNRARPELSGLTVRKEVGGGSGADTLRNFDGLAVMFPAGAVGGGETALLDVSTPVLDNPLERVADSAFRMIGGAYDIEEINGTAFHTSDDSPIVLAIRVPDGFRSQATQRAQRFTLGWWDTDSLVWHLVSGSKVVVSDTDTVVTAPVLHLSRYGVLVGAGEKARPLEVSPNPFSPYAVAERYSAERRGTRIRFGLSAQVEDVKIRIYNILGDLVWAVYGQGLGPGDIEVWWNGKTTEREMPIDQWEEQGNTAGWKMCRNGRYIVVVAVRNGRERIERQVKPVVLMK